MVQTFNTITPAPGPLTEEKQAKMREPWTRTISLMANVYISAYFGAQRLLFSLRHGTHTSELMKTVTTDGTCGQETVLLAPLQSPDAQIRLNRLVLNR